MMLMGFQSSSKSNSSQEIQTPQEADIDAEDSGKTQLSVNCFQFLLYWPTFLYVDVNNFGKHSFE